MVGRTPELEVLERLWSEVEDNRRQVLFIGGEPGAGKTRLIAEAAGVLHDSGVAVLVGGSTPDAGVPYQPFAEMLDFLFSTASPGSLAAVVGDGGPELRRLSRGVTRHVSLGDTGQAAGEIRRDLFEAVAALFRALAADRPVTIVLEDLHWAQLPTLALLEYLVQSITDDPLLILATFRTTAPDRSDEVSAHVAELHRLDGVRRIDLGGLDTDAIAEYVGICTGLPPRDVRAPAVLLRDRTGGNAFFLREMWVDLERRGGISALRSPQRVPASIGDTLAARLAHLDNEARDLIELAAIVGDRFDLAMLVAASETPPATTIALLEPAAEAGLVEAGEQDGQFSFVHALTRQTVLDRMPASRRTQLHARVAQALERQQPHPSLAPRLANHYLAASVLGYEEEALRYSREAGHLAERSLAFEEAAGWFERAASLPTAHSSQKAELLLAAADNFVRAGLFPHARDIYGPLARVGEPEVRLAGAMGYEDATWRPGLVGSEAAHLLEDALNSGHLREDDPQYASALGSLGRALALAGETQRARRIGARAIELARATGDVDAISHTLTTSLWHGTKPDVAQLQFERTAEVCRLAGARRDYETLGAAVAFRGMVTYLLGYPDEFFEAFDDYSRCAEMTGQPYYRHVYYCAAHTGDFLRGDFAGAERWTNETIDEGPLYGDDMTEGPHGSQMFMLARERGTLERFRSYLDGREAFTGRWVPGLLALYTELRLEAGIRRALQHLLHRDLAAHTDEAQWPMELVFLIEAALTLGDRDAVDRIYPFLDRFRGMNLACGTLIAAFGSADRYLARVAAFRGDPAAADDLFTSALEMDQRMRSVVHTAETLAHQALFLAERGDGQRSTALATEAREIAERIGQGRVLNLLDGLGNAESPQGPDRLTDREVAVLRLLAGGLSNSEIGARLHISANTAANHVRSILQKTGAANRTQAAIYAAQHRLAESPRGSR